MNYKKNNPIDIVISWVDGSDNFLIKKRKNYLKSNLNYIPPGAQPTRFSSLNEINYCLISILKFASFVRKIFIVTDEQTPSIHEIVKKYYPKRISDIEIIDHKHIFRDYEDFLPTFNSICISNMLWRIEGLSDHFVYFNDDVFLTRKILPEVWFKKARPVLRGNWVFPPFERLIWDKFIVNYHKLRFGKSKEKTPSFQINQWNAAQLLKFKFRYLKSSHTPLAIDKKVLENYFTNNKKILKENLKFRFRNYKQYNTVALANHLEYKTGNKNLSKSQAVYMRPYNRGEKYITRKFKQCEKNQNNLFLCIQSLDLATQKEQQLIFKKLNSLLDIQIN